MLFRSHHAALVQWQNSLTSHWYEWPLPTRPILMRFDRAPGGLVRVMIALDNPLVWWTSWALVVGTLGRLLWLAERGSAPLRAKLGHVRSEVLLCSAWLGFLSPWVITARDSYLYHYLPCHAFALVLLGGMAARGFRRFPRATLLTLSLVAATSVFYAPIWAQLPLTERALAQRLWLPAWR